MLSLPLYRQQSCFYSLSRGKEERNNYAAFQYYNLLAPFKMGMTGFSLVGVVLDRVHCPNTNQDMIKFAWTYNGISRGGFVRFLETSQLFSI